MPETLGVRVLVLIAIGLVAGLITSISPCVLPVLPVVLAAGAARSRAAAGSADAPEGPVGPTVEAPSDRPAGRIVTARRPTGARGRRVRSWRPYGVVAGLVISFSASTLLGSLVLSALGLPQDLLRYAGIAVLVVAGLGMISRPVGELIERPFVRLTGRPVNPERSGLVVGLGAGLLFVPCAGPVLATIAVVGATHRIGLDAVVLTVAFGVGVGVPLLLLALAGDAVARRAGFLRRHGPALRVTGGVVMIAMAAAIGFNLTDGLQRAVPGYTTALQGAVESNEAATQHLQQLTTGPAGGAGTADAAEGGDGSCQEGAPTPVNCGPAPALAGIDGWLNTPGDQPLDLASLRGKVVLIDFWTYSCINCQRALPHVEAWYQAYQQAGLVVIGVHTPEFAFEHVPGNVAAQAAALGVRYPVAIDNDYATWDAYRNQYWPAEYLIDGSGTIRHVTFGEGDYDGTEGVIRQLLTSAKPGLVLPPRTDVADASAPTASQTPETYLGYDYPQSVSGTTPARDRSRAYSPPAGVDPDTFALAGTWKAGPEALTSGSPDARIELNYQADKVYLVLGGTGTVTTEVGGVTSTIPVSGPPKLYTLVDGTSDGRAILTVTASPGIDAYDFTFG